MGPHLMYRPPKFVQGFIDRHGKPRFYFRRPGFKRVPLPGLPWSPEFMAAYEEALAGQLMQVGGSRVKPGTVRALAISYYNSLSFRSLKPSSQAIYRRIIDRFCREHGDKRAATLQRAHIVKLMAARAEKPGSANSLHKVLRAMMQHAVETGLRSDDPTRDVKVIRVKTDGYHSWTESEIEQFEARHMIGSRARLAFALLLYTGQRRSDVVRMGRQHIRDGALQFRQLKTRAELSVPVHPALAAIIAETGANHLTFLVTDQDKPYSAAGFGNWFRDQCRAAGLYGCSAHGLRKAAARRLAEAGCTAHEIAAITGHASLREIVRYTKAVDQKKLAAAAIEKVKAGTSSVKPTAKFDQKREIS
ncbi:MAG TPA: tyrosine-type recombinase/integrase [Pseudolabrys sp.]|nr:tyrosine-type recombinase/integrase [Pseudolabrys sp.]